MTRHHQYYEESTTDSATPRLPRPSLVVRITAILGLILIVALLMGCNNATAEAPSASTASKTIQPADMDWVKQKAKETGGDFNKLTPEDQKRLTALHGNQAPNVLKGLANPAPENF